MLQDEDTSWTMLPTSASSQQQGSSRAGGQGSVGEVVEEEVFEYERYLPLRGWSASHLSSLDPYQFSRNRNGSRSSSAFPRVPLPQVSVLGAAAQPGRLRASCLWLYSLMLHRITRVPRLNQCFH